MMTEQGRSTRSGIRVPELLVLLLVALLIPAFSHLRLWSVSIVEAWGFATGGICVWLVVREHVWNWPVGLANNVVFFLLFLKARLFADMGLQLVYFGLGIYGWINWVRGGENHSRLLINRTPRHEWVILAVTIPLATWGLRHVLVLVNGAAPFWDSLTTVLCLAAQYLLCRKRFENWYFWIMADVIYVPLYLSRSLPLTSLLYGVFLVMCVVGLREWQRKLSARVDES